MTILIILPFQAKLRYDPVELDPEEMCRMASEEPQVSYKNCLLMLLYMYACTVSSKYNP